MGITYGDHLIDSGYYDITPEQEREIWAREECARRGIDPDEICADGGVTAWMVVAEEPVSAPACPKCSSMRIRYESGMGERGRCLTCGNVGGWHEFAPCHRIERCSDCWRPGDCDGSCTHPEPEPAHDR